MVKFIWEIARAIIAYHDPITDSKAIAKQVRHGVTVTSRNYEKWLARTELDEKLAVFTDVVVVFGLSLSLLFWIQLVMEIFFAHEGSYPITLIYMQSGFHFGVFCIHLTFFIVDLHSKSVLTTSEKYMKTVGQKA